MTAEPNRCMAIAPEALSGHLGVLKCRLTTRPDGTHDGQHKASRMISGVGKVVVRWFSPRHDPPPEVILPLAASPVLNARQAYRVAFPHETDG